MKRMRADERYKSSSCYKTDTVMGCNDVDNIRRMLVWVYSVWHVVVFLGEQKWDTLTSFRIGEDSVDTADVRW